MCASHPTALTVRLFLPLHDSPLTHLQNMHIRLGCKTHAQSLLRHRMLCLHFRVPGQGEINLSTSQFVRTAYVPRTKAYLRECAAARQRRGSNRRQPEFRRGSGVIDASAVLHALERQRRRSHRARTDAHKARTPPPQPPRAEI